MVQFALARVKNVRIAGLSACVPSNVVDNKIFGESIYKNEISNVIKTTGVSERRTCPENVVTSLDLSVRAADYLRNNSNFDFNDIAGVIFVTSSPDFLMPNNATSAQYRLGLSGATAAFDINLACSGYIYGLWVAAMMAKSLNKSILLLDGETNSHFASPKDYATALLFGDAGTASIIEPCEDDNEWTFVFETDGSQRNALIIPEGGYRKRIDKHSSEYKTYPDGGIRRGIDMQMDGMGVFNFVVRNVPKSLQYLMAETNTTSEDYDILALHQANLFMVRQLAKIMKFSMEKVPTTIQKFGNSSSATIPVTISAELHKQISTKKLRFIASGFGAGLSLASVSMEIGPCFCPGVVEYEC
jgi:3-oxoacyl-[acyl-carrier-protein] synthase-3